MWIVSAEVCKHLECKKYHILEYPVSSKRRERKDFLEKHLHGDAITVVDFWAKEEIDRHAMKKNLDMPLSLENWIFFLKNVINFFIIHCIA